MITAVLSFSLPDAGHTEVLQAAGSLLAVWHKNGQIVGNDWPMAAADGTLRAYVRLPAADALDSSFANAYVLRDLERLSACGAGRPVVEILGVDPDTLPPCACTSRGSLILFTDYLTLESPLRCGNCFDPVALYRVPATKDFEYLDVLQWAADYKACDTLQMGCTTGERFGEQQLVRHDSSLSIRGRQICRRLAERTNAPTYYHLHKSRGRSLGAERRRRCPNCHGDWLLAERWHNRFDFRCDDCRLLSNVASNVAA